MTDRIAFMAGVGGVEATIVGEDFDPAEMVWQTLLGLDQAQRVEFLDAFAENDWSLLIVMHAAHPEFAKVLRWVKAQPDEDAGVVFLATMRGPAPPVIGVFENNTPGGPPMVKPEGGWEQYLPPPPRRRPPR